MLARAIAVVVLVLGTATGPAAADIKIGAVTIRNASGNSVGKIDSDGSVRNDSGNSVGKIEESGTIRNGSGNSIGKIDSDGTVRDGSGNSIGRVDSDGGIRNGSGNSIGKVDGYSSSLRQEIAALLFFFDAIRGLR